MPSLLILAFLCLNSIAQDLATLQQQFNTYFKSSKDLLEYLPLRGGYSNLQQSRDIGKKFYLLLKPEVDTAAEWNAYLTSLPKNQYNLNRYKLRLITLAGFFAAGTFLLDLGGVLIDYKGGYGAVAYFFSFITAVDSGLRITAAVYAHYYESCLNKNAHSPIPLRTNSLAPDMLDIETASAKSSE